MKTRSTVISLAVLLSPIGLLATATPAAADVNGAAKAFSQAQEAMLSGDSARAADLYELADELAPSAPALRNATRARLAAGHYASAANNAAALFFGHFREGEREVAHSDFTQAALEAKDG